MISALPARRSKNDDFELVINFYSSVTDNRTPTDLFTMYDPSTLAFNPAVPTPSSSSINYKKLAPDDLHSPELQAEIDQVSQVDHMKIWQDCIKQKSKAAKPVTKSSTATAQS